MKKIILSITLGIGGTLVNAQGLGLDSIIVEKYYVATAADTVGGAGLNGFGVLPIGSVTYRVYVDLKAGYQFSAVYGEAVPSHNHNFVVSTSTSFFNNRDRGQKSGEAINSSYLTRNTVALDSWFSVGGTADDQLGVLKSEDDGLANILLPHIPSTMLTNTVSALGIALSTQDGSMAGLPEPTQFAGFTTELDIFDDVSQSGDSLITNNAAIASLVGSVGPTPTNRVLIGQFTTDGIFHFELNLQIRDGLANGTIEKWVASNPDIGEFTMASLTYTSPSPVTPTNVLPTVAISAPVNAASYTGGDVVSVAATATDSDGTIDSVVFFVDGVKIGKTVASPFTSTFVSTVGTHTITAVATDNKNGSTTSSAVTITVIPTGISELNANVLSLSVYPNPANELVTIDINTSKPSNVVYTIYDVTGSMISGNKIGVINGNYKQQINVASLASGLYFLEISIDCAVSTQKLIID
jgi:hypothetical protein